MVSNAFAEVGFDVIASIDIDDESNATINQDICLVDPSSFSAVADCIWASPDCSTYSCLGGNNHRIVSKGEYSKSNKAHKRDEIFMHMVRIMAYTKARHRHCTFIIENPASGSLKNLPRKYLRYHVICVGKYLKNAHASQLCHCHPKVMVSSSCLPR